MSAFSRGLRNVLRNRTRSLLVILILALSVAIFVTMLEAGRATAAQAARLRAETATLIQVTPPGVPAGGGGDATLPAAWATDIRAIPHVARVEAYLRKQITDNTRQFSMGAITGVESGGVLRLAAMGGFTGAPRIVDGRTLAAADAGQTVAVVGEVFARQQGVGVGDEFTLSAAVLRGRGEPDGQVNELRARVVGIFATGVVFGDNQLFVPLDVAQRALGTEGQVTGFAVTASEAARVAQVEADLKARLGGRVDVISEQAAAQLTSRSLSAVSANSLWAAVVAGAVGALVVLLTMVLITRERTAEIVTLKAIGASDGQVARQFAAEALGLAMLGGLLGLLVAAAAGSGLATVLLGSAAPPASAAAGFGLSPGAVVAALALALLFALVGSLYPAARAARLRPGEALRAG